MSDDNDRLLGALMARMDALEKAVAQQSADIKAVRTLLDQAQGGMTALRILGFGSLASFLTAAAGIWAWVKGMHH